MGKLKIYLQLLKCIEFELKSKYIPVVSKKPEMDDEVGDDVTVETVDESEINGAGGDPTSGPTANSNPDWLFNGVYAVIDVVQTNGWILLIVLIGLWFAKQKLEEYLKEKRRRDGDAAHAKDPDELLDLVVWRRIDDFLSGKGYKPKSRNHVSSTTESSDASPPPQLPNRPRQRLRDDDYNPMTGGGGSGGYRPAPRGGSGGG